MRPLMMLLTPLPLAQYQLAPGTTSTTPPSSCVINTINARSPGSSMMHSGRMLCATHLARSPLT
ncbi:hypothetical protein PF005_g4377 [Phytophthora fragariae]|uniref:RxLR effector protein n=2 Tax=Phytophthora TaxID=4783 RepID=A0A6A3U329_9STRA|nr:hypothetical protein PF003_g16352 [Phytophthora fragariae]KAE9030597.1 hypothetical protein PR002_g9839 [Phytophthora rubi]KAE8938238.1 hypothetical protein PF009_g11876 [Phytophthora fragariae]KAE9017907.1 hypothetical protein PF011_g6497 [Phytophthora fragariae]KAE9034353.1 hypothetical protein PR001_g9768 [Phytophthora rubi]